MATEILAEDLRSELCRECDKRGVKLGDPVRLVILDKQEADTGVRAVASRYVCEDGHVWHSGEGKARGRGGEAPILLEEHYAHRRSKETYMENGVIDGYVQPGFFHRDHVDR
jgi:hypothetical protein